MADPRIRVHDDDDDFFLNIWGNKYIEWFRAAAVIYDDDDDDDDDDDEAPPLPPPLFPLVLLFPFDFPNPRLFCFVLAFLVLGLFVSSLLLSPRVRLCLITFVGRPFSSFRTSIRRGLRSAVGMVLVLLLPLRWR